MKERVWKFTMCFDEGKSAHGKRRRRKKGREKKGKKGKKGKKEEKKTNLIAFCSKKDVSL